MGIHKQIFQLNLIRTAVKRNVNAIKHAGYPKRVFIEELKVELKKDMESLVKAGGHGVMRLREPLLLFRHQDPC